MPRSASWIAFYLYCFLIGILLASLRAPIWIIAVLFVGAVIVHTLALEETPSNRDEG